MRLAEMVEVTFPGPWVTRTISGVMLMHYLKRKGWVEQRVADAKQFVIGRHTLTLCYDNRGSEAGARRGEIEHLARIEDRPASEILREIVGERRTLDAAHDELLAACAALEITMMPAKWRLDSTLVSDAARVACAARDYIAIGPRARDPESYVARWTRVLRAAEDVALIALEQIVAARGPSHDHV